MTGHLKLDSRMDRNISNGKDGDRFNTILCAAGQNMRKLFSMLRKNSLFVYFILLL